MAESKKSFILYTDLIHTVRKMPADKAGELFMTILAYVNDENPQPTDIVVDLVFEPIKRQLKRDLVSWEAEKSSKSAGAILGNLKRWHPKLYEKVVSGEKTVDEVIAMLSDSDSKQSQPIAPIAVTVTDTVNVTVTENKTPTPSAVYVLEFNKIRGSNFKNTDAVSKKFAARIKEGYTCEQMLAALKNAMQVQFHKENGYMYLTPEFFCRSDKIELFINTAPKAKEETTSDFNFKLIKKKPQ